MMMMATIIPATATVTASILKTKILASRGATLAHQWPQRTHSPFLVLPKVSEPNVDFLLFPDAVHLYFWKISTCHRLTAKPEMNTNKKQLNLQDFLLFLLLLTMRPLCTTSEIQLPNESKQSNSSNRVHYDDDEVNHRNYHDAGAALSAPAKARHVGESDFSAVLKIFH